MNSGQLKELEALGELSGQLHQTNDAVEALNAVVVTLNDRLRALEGHLGAINTPLQASMYDFVMAAQAATQKARSDSTNAAAFER